MTTQPAPPDRYWLRSADIGAAVRDPARFDQLLVAGGSIFGSLEANLPRGLGEDLLEWQTPPDYYLQQLLLATAADSCEFAVGVVRAVKGTETLTALVLARALLERVAMTRYLCARFREALEDPKSGERLNELYMRTAFALRAPRSNFVGPKLSDIPLPGIVEDPKPVNVLTALDSWRDPIEVKSRDGEVSIDSVRALYDQISEHVHPNAQWYWRHRPNSHRLDQPSGASVLLQLGAIGFTTAAIGLRDFPQWWSMLPIVRDAVAAWAASTGRTTLDFQFENP